MSKSRAFGGGDVILVDVFSNKLRKQKKLVSTNTCNPFNFSVDEARELTDEVENILA